MTDEQKKKLEQKLWDIANTLRGKMDADEFRDYILGFIFYKYLSERMHAYAARILGQDNIEFTDINEDSPEGAAVLDAVKDASVEALGYFLKPSELFSAVAKRGEQGAFILGDLSTILSNIERSTMGTASEEDFDHLFEDLDLTSTKLGRTEDAKNALIARVLTHLDAIDFRLDDAKADVLGDAYEYLIGQFASGAGKKAGEFYTPQQVSTILARIVTTGKRRLKSVYDPTCGSGSLLLRVAREVSDVGDFFGQEMNRTTYNLARMNMILHGVHYRNFDLKQEDTLEHPQHEGMQFEAIVANPPFSAKWSARPLFLQDDRFAQYGKLAPSSKADYAFVTHMLAHLDDNGTMAVVLSHGALFRGGAEGVIREYIIREKNWLDAVIGLPENIFYGTEIATCILVFKKCRETDDILFIDASSCFESGKKENKLRDSDVERVVDGYKKRQNEDRFSYRASREEIAKNEFDLSIKKYVDTFKPTAKIDLSEIDDASRVILEASNLVNKRLADIFAQLDLKVTLSDNIPTLERFKEALIQRLFNRDLRFKKPSGEEFPDWEWVSAGSVFRSVSNKNHVGELPILSITQENGAMPREDTGIDIKASAGSIASYKVVEPGDFIISLRSFQGGIEYSEVRGICSPAYTVMKPIRPINDGFYKYFLKSADFVTRLAMTVVGIRDGKQISYSAFSALSLPYPDIEEQRLINRALSVVDYKIALVRADAKKVQLLVEKMQGNTL